MSTEPSVVAAKIVAVSHGFLAVILVCFATTIPQSRALLVGAATVACAVVAYGCWAQRRSVAALGAVPLGAIAIAATRMANRLPGVFDGREKAAIGVVGFSVVALEIVAVMVAGKTLGPPGSSSE
jgi:hypothetical protein